MVGGNRAEACANQCAHSKSASFEGAGGGTSNINMSGSWSARIPVGFSSRTALDHRAISSRILVSSLAAWSCRVICVPRTLRTVVTHHESTSLGPRHGRSMGRRSSRSVIACDRLIDRCPSACAPRHVFRSGRFCDDDGRLYRHAGCWQPQRSSVCWPDSLQYSLQYFP